jgi:dihydrofolate reductase
MNKGIETTPEPEIALIGAMAENRIIGRGNKMLWRLPEDLKFFFRVTKGHPVIMGRKTYESIGRPLPGRRNIVLTRDASFHADGLETAGTVAEALTLASGAERICVIGGGVVYGEFLPLANSMYVTRIHHTWEGDASFPAWNEKEWSLRWEQQGAYNAANPYAYTFQHYVRVE